MPELPEVETVARSLAEFVTNRTVRSVDVRCAMLRRSLPPDFAARLEGRRILEVRRRAKYLILDLDEHGSWIVHLGMSGRLSRVDPVVAHELHRHDHVVVTFEDATGLVFHDPRRFGLMTIDDPSTSAVLRGIGPEPLSEDFNPAYLAQLRRSTRRTIKDVLMDQHVVGGLGNIYVNELLHVAGVRPRRRLSAMTRRECARVVEATRSVLREAIALGGSSISDFLDGIGRPGNYQAHRRVYDRTGEACAACATPIRSVVVGQRSSFYCPRCQR
jgi:formamidopyrimidine-DNA glycosylase